MTKTRIYLDHAAMAPMHPEAQRLLCELSAESQANPASAHEPGRRWKDRLEAARSRVAGALACRPREVVFAAGGTEAANIGVFGLAAARAGASRRVIVSKVEHPAVLAPIRALRPRGFEIVEVTPNGDGCVDPEAFLSAVGEDAAFAALMAANHEMGAVMPVAAVGAVLRERGIPLLCDAALAPGRLDASPEALQADVIACSGAKFGAPAGTGFLVVRRTTRLTPWMCGGVQEERLRPGSLPIPAFVALGAALEHAQRDAVRRAAGYTALIDVFLEALAPEAQIRSIGDATRRLPGLVTLELGGVEGEAVMINMDLEGISVATGSTCALGSADPSPTLLAMGFQKPRAASTIRISVGEGVDANSMTRAASTLSGVVLRLRSLQGR